MNNQLFKNINNEWTNASEFPFKVTKEDKDNTQLKSLLTYKFTHSISKEKDYGKKTCSCSNERDCDNSISQHIQKFESNNDSEFKELFTEQAKIKKVKLKDHWTVLRRTESYVEECSTCDAKGEVECTKCHQSGKITCTSCGGSGENRCMSCFGSGKSGDKNCFSCGGSGDKRCLSCFGGGRITCTSCDGSLWVTCGTCKGHQYFTFYQHLDLQGSYTNNISWDEEHTKKWINDYLKKETVNHSTIIDLMEESEWFKHTFNLSDLDKDNPHANIQGQLETSTYLLENNKHTCLFIGKEENIYDLDNVFTYHINNKIENCISIDNEKDLFENKIVSEIIDEENDYPVQSNMITEHTNNSIKEKFKSMVHIHTTEQNNIDVPDIAKWSGIFGAFWLFFFTLFGSFTPTVIDWKHISLPNFFKNTADTLQSIPVLLDVSLQNSPLYLVSFVLFTLGTTWCLKKLLASSKESFLRFSLWYIAVAYLTFFFILNYINYFSNGIETWQFSLSYIEHSFINTGSLLIDIVLVSFLMGILKARQINCFKMRNISTIINSKKLKEILGY